jgi:hypothetical protein
MTEDYREFRLAEREMRKAMDQMVGELRRVCRARCEAGRSRYDRMIREHREAKGVPSAQNGG